MFKDSVRLLEKLGVFVPGFKGYQEREIRRESDLKLREELLKRLEDAKYELYGMEEEYFDDLKKVKDVEILLSRLGKLKEMVSQNQTESKFFKKDISQEDLKKLYSTELALFNLLKEIKSEEDLSEIKRKFSEFEKKFQWRERLCM
ncbi:MAG: hypothetical protein ACE5K0_02475 [Candidatus Methanofastidiosia archaeon]